LLFPGKSSTNAPPEARAPPLRARPGDGVEEFPMFISTAYAQGVGGFASNDMLVQFLPIVLIFVVFYFLLILPQQKKAKQHKAMLSQLRRGDRVVTGGGIIGTVAKVVNDEEVSVEIAEGTRVRVLRGTITSVLARTEPASGGKDADEPAEEKAKSKAPARAAGSK
jgi:preprotein translocase subunit YajC